jgi:ribosomal protein L24E
MKKFKELFETKSLIVKKARDLKGLMNEFSKIAPAIKNTSSEDVLTPLAHTFILSGGDLARNIYILVLDELLFEDKAALFTACSHECLGHILVYEKNPEVLKWSEVEKEAKAYAINSEVLKKADEEGLVLISTEGKIIEDLRPAIRKYRKEEERIADLYKWLSTKTH